MTQDTWKLFPRLIEQKINALLDEAEPNDIKAYQLYKTCKNENLWRNSFELFQLHLSDFFSLPKSERVKSYFDKFLDRPMNRIIYDGFTLNFRTSQTNQTHLTQTAKWTHQIMKNNCNTSEEIISAYVFTQTLNYITRPPAYEKDHDIEFEDFCIAWKKTVFSLFGNQYNSELEDILREIRWLNQLLKNPAPENEITKFRPGIYLTQTEIDWTSSVQEAVFEYRIAPHFPLSKGPQKEKLINLNRAVSLYNIVLRTDKAEVKKHLESVRLTILDQSGWLMRQKAS